MAHDLSKIELGGCDHGADDRDETELSARSSLYKSYGNKGQSIKAYHLDTAPPISIGISSVAGCALLTLYF